MSYEKGKTETKRDQSKKKKKIRITINFKLSNIKLVSSVMMTSHFR